MHNIDKRLGVTCRSGHQYQHGNPRSGTFDGELDKSWQSRPLSCHKMLPNYDTQLVKRLHLMSSMPPWPPYKYIGSALIKGYCAFLDQT